MSPSKKERKVPVKRKPSSHFAVFSEMIFCESRNSSSFPVGFISFNADSNLPSPANTPYLRPGPRLRVYTSNTHFLNADPSDRASFSMLYSYMSVKNAVDSIISRPNKKSFAIEIIAKLS